ncbi:RNA polymerase sigma-70 factor [Bacteroides fluxus]|jgi:RNA polymerase sigma-70 factor (ECF subfamily)|uniref:RNA polymerase sigma-70 factor n=1 Tax=Bacteroides fluxus TaxID=626930 RepID=UPI0026DB13C7|nr:RNA polymerase sigma-70 factor [Bacteroides fluxus]
MMGEDVVVRFKSGDKAAFEILYRRYWQRVYKFTSLYIVSDIELEDVVQEVFIKFWEARSLVDETKNIAGFLFIITRNLIFNHSRRSFNENFYQLTVLETLETSNSVEDELAASDLHNYLELLLDKLSPRQQEVFRLSRKEQLSYKEIAERLNISEKTVENHIGEALKYLKKNLQLYCLFMMLG